MKGPPSAPAPPHGWYVRWQSLAEGQGGLPTWGMRVTPAPYLDQRPDNAQAGEAQVLEGPRFGHGLEEGVQEQRDVRCRGQSVGSMCDVASCYQVRDI